MSCLGKTTRRKLLALCAEVGAFGLTVGIIAGGAAVSIATREVTAKERVQQVVNETIIYGVDGKASSVRISGWENPSMEFVPLDIKLDLDLQEYIFYLCSAYDIDYAFVLGLIDTESRFKSNTVSSSGDYGLMQINKGNHAMLQRALGVMDFTDPYDNVKAGLYILRMLFERYRDAGKVCMAYNLGEGGASRLWKAGVTSTKYSNEVLERRDKYKEMLENGG